MTCLGVLQQQRLMDAVGWLEQQFDFLLIDTAAGISDLVTDFLRTAGEIVLVVRNEPASITDAYALIKAMRNEFGIDRFRIVANQATSERDAQGLYEHLTSVADRFLDVALLPSVAIPYDDTVLKSVRKQRTVIDAYPRSPAAQAFHLLAVEAARWSLEATNTGKEDLARQLLRVAGRNA